LRSAHCRPSPVGAIADVLLNGEAEVDTRQTQASMTAKLDVSDSGVPS